MNATMYSVVFSVILDAHFGGIEDEEETKLHNENPRPETTGIQKRFCRTRDCTVRNYDGLE